MRFQGQASHPTRAFESCVRQVLRQLVPAECHVLDELQYSGGFLAGDVHHSVVIRIDQLPPMVRNDEQVIANAAALSNHSQDPRPQLLNLVGDELDRPLESIWHRQSIGDPAADLGCAVASWTRVAPSSTSGPEAANLPRVQSRQDVLNEPSQFPATLWTFPKAPRGVLAEINETLWRSIPRVEGDAPCRCPCKEIFVRLQVHAVRLPPIYADRTAVAVAGTVGVPVMAAVEGY